MTVAIVRFPGSNCDQDVERAVREGLGAEARYVWHKSHDLGKPELVVLPGGFSYGDYLRAGAIARFSPIMREVIAFAEAGGRVLGICNGFQVLCEARLLPGALVRNRRLRFRCIEVNLRVETARTPFSRAYAPGDVLRLPIAHGEGQFVAPAEALEALEDEGRVVFRYVDGNGEATPEGNPNGSAHNIAGICNRERNVVGMMPHPERAALPYLGSTDGLGVFAGALGLAGKGPEPRAGDGTPAPARPAGVAP